jgi:hypothetical protein
MKQMRIAAISSQSPVFEKTVKNNEKTLFIPLFMLLLIVGCSLFSKKWANVMFIEFQGRIFLGRKTAKKEPQKIPPLVYLSVLQ